MTLIQSLSNDYPILGLFISLLLYLSFYFIGNLITLNKRVKNIVLKISNLEYQNTLIGINFIILILFPLVLFLETSKNLIIFISVILIILGFIQLVLLILKSRIFFNYYKNISYEEILIIIYIFLYFIISLSPITHADSLDYHMEVSKHIAATGKFPSTLNNYHNLLFGSGETLMALGFIYNSEQLGNLIQFSGLLSLIGIIRCNSENKFFYSIAILSSPALIFLCSSPKPQLFALASNAFVFSIVFFSKQFEKLDKKDLIYLSFIILIFIINSVNIKFSFLLSSSILFILSSIFFYKKKFLLKFLIYSIIVALILYLPFIMWKHYYWGGDLINYFISPFPNNLQGVDYFKNYLIGYKRSYSFFDLIIPKNIGSFTNIIGITFLLCFALLKLKTYVLTKFLFVSALYLIIIFNFGQMTSRFLIELIFWMIIIFSFEKVKLNILIKIPIYIQSIFVAIVLFYGCYNLFPGSLTKSLYEKTMHDNANGYSLVKWAESKLEKDTKFILMHRSTGLSENALSTTFLDFLRTDSENAKEIFLNIFFKENPKYIVAYKENQNFSVFNDCLESLVFFEKNIGKYTGRNPFNVGEYYDGYIFKIKDIKETRCINK